MKKNITTIFLLTVLSFTNAQNNTFPTTGNVGIGTLNPLAKLHIFNGDNSYGTILANASESPFSLYTKTLTTNQANAEAFRLGLKYNEDENNGYISFHRGGGTYGGFLSFSSNGAERMRIDSYGNVGIGTTNPQAKLHVIGNAIMSSMSANIIYGVDTIVSSNIETDNLYVTDILGPGGSMAELAKIQEIFAETINTTAGIKIGGNSEIYAGLKVNGDITTGGSNSWIFHTPDDGRTTLYIAPLVNGNWDWGKEFAFEKNGNASLQGKLEAKEVKVTTTPTADFVFAEDYQLPKLEEVEKHIKEKKHLPEISSASEMEKEGVNVGKFQIKLLQKIEELTLYSIEQNKQLKTQNEKIFELEKTVQELKAKTNH